MCSIRFSLHKFVHLTFFWTLFKNVHCQGLCILRPCISRPYCKFFWNSFLNWAEKYTAHLYTFKVFIPVCMWNLELLSSFLGSKIQFLLRPGYVESTFFYCKRSNDSKNVELDRPSITQWRKLLNFDQKFETKSEITYLLFHN